MHRAFKVALTFAVAVCFALPLSLVAQTQTLTGSVAGRAVDPAGRGVVGQRVELISADGAIASVTTNGLGEWSFNGVQPGVYTVRMNVRGRIAGVRVAVAAGQSVSGTLVVVPAASASLQFGALASFISLVPAAASAAVTQVTANLTPTETANLSPQIVQQIFTELAQTNPAAAVALAQNILTASTNQNPAAAPFANATTALNVIVASGGTAIPTIPPVASVS